MGEYVEPSSTTHVIEQLVKPSNDGWLESVPLSAVGDGSQNEILVLAWILLLSRGTVNSDDGAFSWSTATESYGCHLASVIGSGATSLREALGIIQSMNHTTKEEPNTLLFSNATPGAEVCDLNPVAVGC